MSDRMQLFKWRAQARRIAKSAPMGSIERQIAAQFRAGLESAMICNLTEDRSMLPKKLERGSDYHSLLMTSSRPMKPLAQIAQAIDLSAALDHNVFPDPRQRINTLLLIFNAVATGTLVITRKLQERFYLIAFDDPDATVRAWALHLLDPEKYPPPEDKEG